MIKEHLFKKNLYLLSNLYSRSKEHHYLMLEKSLIANYSGVKERFYLSKEVGKNTVVLSMKNLRKYAEESIKFKGGKSTSITKGKSARFQPCANQSFTNWRRDPASHNLFAVSYG